jgi:hypothetical protein
MVGHLAAHYQYRHHTDELQLKLDELIRVNGKARNRLLRLEGLTGEGTSWQKTGLACGAALGGPASDGWARLLPGPDYPI